MKKDPIPIQNLFYMLCYAWNVLPIKDAINVSSEKITNSYNLLGRVFSYGVGKLIRQGFYRSYITSEDELSVLKGKVLISNTINNASLIKKKIYCEFDEFTSNNLLNQIIKYTLNNLIKNSSIDTNIKNDLKKQIIYFNHIDETKPDKHNLQKLKFNKNNFIYKLLISIAIILYNNTFVNENDGKTLFNDFYREEQMQRVYELFLLNFYTLHLDKKTYRVHAPKINWDIDENAFDGLDVTFNIDTKVTDRRTDLVIENKKEKIQFIIDAKYYKDALVTAYQDDTRKTYRTNHINQIRGYILDSKFYGKKYGALIYPTVYENEIETGFPIKKAPIFIKTINLNQDWQKIENDLLNFAFKIVK